MTTPGSYGPGEQPPSGAPGWGQPAGGPPHPGSVPPGQTPPPQGQFPPGQYPPPQGQFPPGQYPPPQGQPPQGQPPQGQYAPGQYPQQGPAWAAGPPKKSGAGKWIGIAIAAVAVLAVIVVAVVLFGAGDPEPGDCLNDESGDLTVVACDDSAADWRFLGIQSGEQGYEEYLADPETCAEFPEAVQSFWVGDTGEQGKVYCATTI